MSDLRPITFLPTDRARSTAIGVSTFHPWGWFSNGTLVSKSVELSGSQHKTQSIDTQWKSLLTWSDYLSMSVFT